MACSDSTIGAVSWTLNSTLVGYVRSVCNAAACARLANVSVTPISDVAEPLTLSHPPLCVSGPTARLCNRHLPPVQSGPMPLGRYALVAEFVLDATASGICNAHAVADFSPDTSLPAEWVRQRDPFQGASKRAFGFDITLTAGPSESRSASTGSPANKTLHAPGVPQPFCFAAKPTAINAEAPPRFGINRASFEIAVPRSANSQPLKHFRSSMRACKFQSAHHHRRGPEYNRQSLRQGNTMPRLDRACLPSVFRSRNDMASRLSFRDRVIR